jgi:hypothetical protein
MNGYGMAACGAKWALALGAKSLSLSVRRNRFLRTENPEIEQSE